MGLLTTHSPIQVMSGAFYRYQAPCHANAPGIHQDRCPGFGSDQGTGLGGRRYENGPDIPTLAPINAAGPPLKYRPSTEAGDLRTSLTDLSHCMKQMQPRCRAKNVEAVVPN